MAEKKAKPAEIKTKATTASVEDFINGITNEQKRKDASVLLEMMKKATGQEPKLWGTTLIGFGEVKIKSPNTGREVDWFKMGFSPRKADFSIYISGNINHQHADALTKLGKHKTGVGCLYVKKLDDIDINVLKGMIEAALKMDFFYK